MASTVHISLHISARCSITLSVFAFVTFRLSDGRTAERTAAQLDYMVESRYQHYSVTNSYKLESVPRRLRSPCPSHRSRTAQRLQTPCPHCSRHSAPSAHKFWRAHKRCPHTDGATVLRFTKHPFRRRVPLRIHEDLVFPTHSHPTPARCGADSSAQGCFCRCDHPATAHGVRPFILASCSFFSHDDLQFASVPSFPSCLS